MKRDSGVIKANRYEELHKREPPLVLRYWDMIPMADLIPHKCFYQLFCYSPMLSTVAANVNVTGSVIINFLQIFCIRHSVRNFIRTVVTLTCTTVWSSASSTHLLTNKKG